MGKFKRVFSWITGLIVLALGNSAASSRKTMPLNIEGVWTLVTIGNGETASKIFTGKIPQLVFNAEKQSATGNNGCNRISTKYILAEPGQLKFGPVMSTKMACPGIAEAETRFMKALTDTDTYTIDDSALVLYKGKKELMRFSNK